MPDPLIDPAKLEAVKAAEVRDLCEDLVHLGMDYVRATGNRDEADEISSKIETAKRAILADRQTRWEQGAQAMREAAGRVVKTTPNGMRYGLGVEEFTKAMVEMAMERLKDEIATAILALHTAPPPEAL